MVSVKSSNIAEVEFHELKDGIGEMDIKFHTGKIYRYENVPQGIYEKMINAESVGKFFDQYVKKAGYKYRVVAEGEKFGAPTDFKFGANILTPCPFCGGQRLRVESVPHGNSEEKDYFVHCDSCACDGPWMKNQAGAERLWNSRVQ